MVVVVQGCALFTSLSRAELPDSDTNGFLTELELELGLILELKSI